MKKTPKILPTYYKSKGTPIFRDTTALPFAKGGPIEDEPGTPPTWNRPQLSPERIAALKALHGDSIFASANPNDLLFYDLNKEAIDNATDFSEFLDPSASVSKSFKEAPTTKDIKTRLSKGWALDTKTGAYFKVPEEIYKEVVFPEPEIMEKMEILDPDPITRKPLGSLVIPEFPAFPTYQMPGYMKQYEFPTIGWRTPLGAKAVQQATGYDRNLMEGYYDEEGNYIPGELQNAQEQNRAPQFVGASSLKDMLAQREYLKTLQQTRGYAQGGTLFAGGGPVKPPKFNVAFNPYAYNPNELVGYSGYGDLSGASIKASTQDLLGRQKDVNALKMPVSVSVNKLYDPNTVNDTIKYGYSYPGVYNYDLPAAQLQSEAQKQLDSAYQPYLSKNSLGVNVEAGIAGSGLNGNIKKRSRGEMTFSGGYNPLSGLSAGVNTKASFALGNDFYRPLKKGDWRVAANLQPFGLRISQAPGYSDMQDIIQQNLQNTAETGQFNSNLPGFDSYSGPGYGSGVQATLGAGLDGELKLPLGTLVGGVGLKYNRAAGEAERLAPSGYLGYSLSGADMSKVASKLPTIPMPNLSPLTGMFNKAKEEEEESSLEMPQETGTGWGDRNLPNATTLEGEEIYVPQRATPGAEPIEFNGGGSNEFGLGGRLAFEPSEYGSDAREQYDDGGPIYTYSKRPGSYYQKTEDGWLINNSSTGGKYIPIDDPTGERAALLNKYAKPQPGINKIYADPLSRNSETTQAVASKVMPQTKEQWQTYTAVQQGNQQRRSDIAKALELQGMTPKQAADTVASYGSDWPTLETAKARDIQIMNKTAADIQAGINPSSMQSFTPRAPQPLMDRVQDIVFNPFTAAGYAVRGQEIPEYLQEKADNGTLGYWSNGQFVEGRNALDTAVDVATPIGWAHSANNIIDRATNDKSGDFWTEENAWDALNILPGLGLAKGAKLVQGLDAAKDLSTAANATGLTQAGNAALDFAQRVRVVPKSTAAELAIDAGNLVREPIYAPQRPSLLNPAIAPNNTKTLPPLTSQGYPGIMPKYDVAPIEAVGQPNVLEQLGIREDGEWFPGIKEFKKQFAAKDASEAPLREAESWLYNWINHPTTQNKIYSSYQEALNSPMKIDDLSKMNVADRIRVKEAYQHNLEEAYKQVANHNPFNRLSYKPISQQILDLPQNEHVGNMGISYTHHVSPDNLLMPEIMDKAGKQSDTGKNYVSRSISDEDKEYTGIHEGGHDWAKDFALTYLGQKDMFNKYSEPHFSPFLTKWNNKLAESELAKDNAGIKNAKKSLEYLEYLKQPTELHARILESRKHFNLTPDDVVTPEKAYEMMLLVGAKKTPINYNFGQALLEDPTATANMFNKAWMTVPAVGGAALLNNNNSENNKQ